MKASNVMSDNDGTLKLSNYVISIFLLYIDKELCKENDLSKIQTCYWMAPEVNLNQPCDTRSDIWALGCLVYELTTGKPPMMKETKGDTDKFIECLKNFGKFFLVFNHSMYTIDSIQLTFRGYCIPRQPFRTLCFFYRFMSTV